MRNVEPAYRCSGGFPCDCWRAGRDLLPVSNVSADHFSHPDEYRDGRRAAHEYELDA